jgi:hypothetical protein
MLESTEVDFMSLRDGKTSPGFQLVASVAGKQCRIGGIRERTRHLARDPACPGQHGCRPGAGRGQRIAGARRVRRNGIAGHPPGRGSFGPACQCCTCPPRARGGDSDMAEAVKVLARAHQPMIWNRCRQLSQLRSVLRELYPAALAAFDALGSGDAAAVLKLARAVWPRRALMKRCCGTGIPQRLRR